MTERVLITGAQGFVGRYLCAELLSRRDDVTVVGTGRSLRSSSFTHDISAAGTVVRAPLASGLDAVENDERYAYRPVDIRDNRAMRELLEELRPSVIFHMASGLRDDAAGHLFPVNVEGTIAVLHAVEQSGLAGVKIVLGSSGSVYGATASVPISEDEPCQPRDLYAVSKLAAEHAARVVASSGDVHLITARIFNIAGPGQEERHAVGRFASQVAAIASGLAPLRMNVGNLTTTRDFIDVRDVARALVILGEQAQPGIYNVATGRETRIGSILDALLDQAKLSGLVELELEYIRDGDISRVCADITLLRSLGFEPTYSLPQTTRDVLDYYLDLIAARVRF